jgi:hypothetical protein
VVRYTVLPAMHIHVLRITNRPPGLFGSVRNKEKREVLKSESIADIVYCFEDRLCIVFI